MKLEIEVITTKTVDAKWITVTAPLHDGEEWGDLFGRTGSMASNINEAFFDAG